MSWTIVVALIFMDAAAIGQKGVESGEWLPMESSHNTGVWSPTKVKIFTLVFLLDVL